jgi:hypothetical protein
MRAGVATSSVSSMVGVRPCPIGVSILHYIEDQWDRRHWIVGRIIEQDQNFQRTVNRLRYNLELNGLMLRSF